jgi:hypothetical protein
MCFAIKRFNISVNTFNTNKLHYGGVQSGRSKCTNFDDNPIYHLTKLEKNLPYQAL